MIRSTKSGPRAGYTLVELLVVMSLIILLAALALGISQTGMFGSQKVISASDRASGWLLISKQRALRDGAPRGVRFFSTPGNPNTFTEAQYIESPEVWVPNPAQEGNAGQGGTAGGARIVFVYEWTPSPMTGAFASYVQPPDVYFVGPVADIAEYDQRVSAGDSLVRPEFQKSVRITNFNVSPVAAYPYLGPTFTTPPGPAAAPINVQLSATNSRKLLLSSMPDLSAAGTSVPTGTNPHMTTMVTYKFGFQGQPRPLLGEPTLQMPAGTAIDYRYGTTQALLGAPVDAQGYRTWGDLPLASPNGPPFNPPTTIGVSVAADPVAAGGFTFDILFAPSGQVYGNTSGLICLWVRQVGGQFPLHPRQTDPVARLDCDPLAAYNSAAQQSLIVVYTKNGLIATQGINPPPAAPTVGYDPYQFAKDGINTGL